MSLSSTAHSLAFLLLFLSSPSTFFACCQPMGTGFCSSPNNTLPNMIHARPLPHSCPPIYTCIQVWPSPHAYMHVPLLFQPSHAHTLYPHTSRTHIHPLPLSLSTPVSFSVQSHLHDLELWWFCHAWWICTMAHPAPIVSNLCPHLLQQRFPPGEDHGRCQKPCAHACLCTCGRVHGGCVIRFCTPVYGALAFFIA